MGQLTVGILFFKSPRPTGWLGEIGVRHWPHRFPSCGLNQLWLLPSLSLSFSLSFFLFWPSVSLPPSFFLRLLVLFLSFSPSFFPFLVSRASATTNPRGAQQRYNFILFGLNRGSRATRLNAVRERETLIGRSEIVGMRLWITETIQRERERERPPTPLSLSLSL